jgi:hypothetical protein
MYLTVFQRRLTQLRTERLLDERAKDLTLNNVDCTVNVLNFILKQRKNNRMRSQGLEDIHFYKYLNALKIHLDEIDKEYQQYDIILERCKNKDKIVYSPQDPTGIILPSAK